MGTKKVTESRIASAPPRAESGTPVAGSIWTLGTGDLTLYKLKNVIGSDWYRRVAPGSSLRGRGSELKQLVAGLSLDKKMEQRVLGKHPKPGLKGALVRKVRMCQRAAERGKPRPIRFGRCLSCEYSPAEPRILPCAWVTHDGFICPSVIAASCGRCCSDRRKSRRATDRADSRECLALFPVVRRGRQACSH